LGDKKEKIRCKDVIEHLHIIASFRGFLPRLRDNLIGSRSGRLLPRRKIYYGEFIWLFVITDVL